MRICVFGAGALGSALGGMLAGEHEVTLIGRKAQVSAVMRSGLRLTGKVDLTSHPKAYASIGRLSPPDVLIITTKAYDTATAVAACRGWATADTRVLTLQNGIGNLELLRRWKGSQAFGGTTSMGAALVSPGVIRVAGLGMTVIGSDLDEEGARAIASAFSGCGMPVRLEREIDREIWAKLAVSSCINPITAVLRVANGELLESAAISRLLAGVVEECVDVARAHGVRLQKSPLVSRVRAVAEDTAVNRSSMLQDIERGRRTEIAQINGMVCELGSVKGIPTPLNKALAAMVGALETAPPEKG